MGVKMAEPCTAGI